MDLIHGGNKNKKKVTKISKPYFSFSMYEKTGDLAVDMVAEFIARERHHQKPIKAVFLKKYYYDRFFYWVVKAMGEKAFWEAYEANPVVLFDDVEIKEASGLMTMTIYAEYYKDKMN